MTTSARPLPLPFVRFFWASAFTVSGFRFSFFHSAFASFRPLLPCFRILSFLFFFSALFPVLLTAAPRCSISSFVPQVFPLPLRLVSSASLPVLLTQLFCLFPFVLPCFAPAAVSQVLTLTSAFQLTSRCSSCLPLSFVRFRFRIQLLSFCFFFSASSQFRLTVASPSLPQFFRSSGFPLPLRLVSGASLPILLTQLSVRFLSSFPASLPQLFHRCFPFGSLLRDRCLASTFFRPLPL